MSGTPRERPGEFVATIGVFDGVHVGHQELIRATRAAASGAEVRVVTFDPPPAAVLAPGRFGPQLTPVGEKVPLLEAHGADRVMVLRFDREMAALDPEAFLARHLDDAGRLRHLVIGHDFALGRDRAGDEKRLAAIGAARGFGVTRLPAVRREGQVVSSTRVRQALAAGDLAGVTDLLGRPYRLLGPVVAGHGRGSGIGIPTANVALPSDKLPPPLGVYAVRARPPGGVFLPAVMNFGRRPTFGGGEAVVEVHLLDFRGDLRGQLLEVDLVHWIREERRFPGPEALVAQIRADMAAAREQLRQAGGPPPCG